MPDQVFVVGIVAANNKDFDNKTDVLREALLAYDFVTDVMDWTEEQNANEWADGRADDG